jgi:hypothetical protein
VVAVRNPYWWSTDITSSYQVLGELQRTSLPYLLTVVPRPGEILETEAWSPTKQKSTDPQWSLSPNDEISLAFRTQAVQVSLNVVSQILWLAAGVMLGAAPGVFLGGLSALGRRATKGVTPRRGRP